MATATIVPNLSTKVRLSFSPRSVLPKSSELWSIQAGFVRVLTRSEEGANLTLGIWSANDVVGKALSTVQPYQIECLTSVQAVAITTKDLIDCTEVLLNHLHQAEELMLIRSYKRIDIMLLKLLNWLANRFGQDANQGRLIDLRLTHQDLSELLGTTRVTVTRALNQLEQQGFIQRLSLQRIVLQQAEYWHYEI
jgi:CRP-like cAMP-binding protein